MTELMMLIIVCIVVLLVLWILPYVLIFAFVMLITYLIARGCVRMNHKKKTGGEPISSKPIYAIIKEIDVYEERLEPAWEYPRRDDQWLFAETVEEYVRTEYNVLYVYEDNTYKEVEGLRSVPPSVKRIARDDLSYDETKLRLKKREWWK